MVIYRSFVDAISDLPPEQFKACAMAIFEYGLDGKEPEGSGIEKTVYCMAKPQIDANNRRYENGCKGGRSKTKINQTETKINQTETKPEPNQTNPEPKEKDKVKDIKENPLKGVKEKRFAPPTLENVIGYCQEKGYVIDAQRFIDFYESKGWMIGKNKMKDWKAAVRNWARQDKTAQTPVNKNAFNNFHQRDYDYAGLQRAMIKNSTGG